MNNKFSIRFSDEAKSIVIHDLTDPNNEPRAHNRNIRSYKMAKKLYENSVANGEINEDTNMWDLVRMFDSVGMKMHTWCAMD